MSEINYSLATCGRTFNPPDWFYNPDYLVDRIYYIVSGTAYYKNTIRLKAGYLYIFKASPDFCVSQDEKDPVDHVYFDFSTHYDLISSDYVEINPQIDIRLTSIISAIKEDFANPPHQENIAKSYLEILFYYLKDYLNPYLLAEEGYSEITKTMLYMIHNKPINELTVNHLADDLNNNVNHIIRCFKKDVGITPHKYISIMKRNLAIAYLRQGMSKTEIAFNLGFTSLSAFSYWFHNSENN